MDDPLATALAEAGGPEAPAAAGALLRRLVLAALLDGAEELRRPRSGAVRAVAVLFAPDARTSVLRVVLPVAPALRADPSALAERAWLLTAAAVDAAVQADARGPVRAGAWEGWLALELEATDPVEPELAVLAFEEAVGAVDRLRAAAHVLPAHVLADAADLRAPLEHGHPLEVARHIAVGGGRPADQRWLAEHDDELAAALEALAGPEDGVAAPHADPDPARRVARRILRRLDGMGKWGGYHTEFTHLSRGFAGHDRALAEEVGEALLAAGLLSEKPSVGQRHVFLDPGHVREIRALVERGELPEDLRLPGS